MNASFHDVMRYATRLTRAGRLSEATAAIQRALAGATGSACGPQPAPGDVIDVAASTTTCDHPGAVRPGVSPVALEEYSPPEWAPSTTTADVVPWHVPATIARGESGPRFPEAANFLAGSHKHASLTRQYKLFVPPPPLDRPYALVVMLHGCTQDPDDFAAGTDMNRLATEHGLCVLYPAQAQEANPSRCWNWFKHNHQVRGRGEPAVIASMTQSVIHSHGIDPGRVYVAGLSAGGAMAALVGAAYPDIFAAVGVHSGLAPGVARSLPEALMAMNGTSAAASTGATAPFRVGTMPVSDPLPLVLPVIVFHGDDDHTVHPRNGEQVVAAALGAVRGPAERGEPVRTSDPRIVQGVSEAGRRYTRHVHSGEAGAPVAEYWILHGAGHAWSGGSATGSYTDPRGPDASREMLRFFLENPRPRAQ